MAVVSLVWCSTPGESNELELKMEEIKGNIALRTQRCHITED